MWGASLVAQWLRICLPMQGTRVWDLVREDLTCRGATRPVSHSCWACVSRACAPQQERPRQWEACAPRWRVALACRNWREPSHRNEDPTQPKINKKTKKTHVVKYYWLMNLEEWNSFYCSCLRRVNCKRVFCSLILFQVKNRSAKPHSSFCSSVGTREKGKSMSTQTLVHEGSKQDYSQQPKSRNNPNVYQLMNG